ncbi:hypothetical protein [Methylocystis heyeri]|uniref:Uncharacterized protein n=1 Tax=Methylocystis heyeri TaxID=391905 RepID=A0A6B8KB83_9HYPH|nr:hypothetical protein [Methylocystis heyeri]QGM45634.1 hypothetical protein H2LOC_007925 [Methylocystis heyeri]
MSALEALPWQISFAAGNIKEYLREAKEARKLDEAITALAKIDTQVDALIEAALTACAEPEIEEIGTEGL